MPNWVEERRIEFSTQKAINSKRTNRGTLDWALLKIRYVEHRINDFGKADQKYAGDGWYR